MGALGRDPTTGLILHDKQLSFVGSRAKRKVICAGRRGGKTTGISVAAARKFKVEHKRVLYAAPTQEQTEQFWEYEKEYFWPDIKTGTIYKNETRRLLEWHGRIRAKTAWDADTMRGDYADEMYLEEYAMMDPSAWDKVGAPMLLDNDGDVTFISTPRLRNHFHKMFLKARADETGRWECWHFTSYDNPYLSEAALAEVTEDMTESAYRQEILAEFLEGEGAVFRNIQACINAPVTTKGDHKGHGIYIGVDWGQKNDFTVCSVGCNTCKQEVALYRSKGLDYALERQKIASLYEHWKCKSGLVELNSMGQPNFEELQRAGVTVSGFDTTSSSKPPLIENMVLALEKEEWQFIDNPAATAELEAYERTVNPHTQRSKYSAPEGMHDDTVMARALMLRAAETSRFIF